MKNFNTKRFFGFTLAEVLVTLAIVGVVAALTIPSLMQANQKRVFTNQLKKAVSEVSQAIANGMEDRHAANLYESKLIREDAFQLFEHYLKVTRSGRNDSASYSCFYNGYYDKLNGSQGEYGTNFSGSSCDTYTCGYYPTWAQLKDGVCVAIRPDYNHRTAYLYIDVNSKQGPNIEGRDLFGAYINERGEIGPLSSCYNCDSSRLRWYHAFYSILRDGWEMKY